MKRDTRFQNLTVDYAQILKKLPVSSRFDMLRYSSGIKILSSIDPSDLQKLFPDYYKREEGVAKTLSSLTGYKYGSESTEDGKASIYKRPSKRTVNRDEETITEPRWQTELAKATGVSIGSPDSAKPGTEGLRGVAEIQKTIYDAFIKEGLSHQQSLALTAEVGRETSYNPKYIFGSHAEPGGSSAVRGRTNQGIFSWGDPSRRRNFVDFMKKEGFMDENGNMVRSAEAIQAQARFVRQEMSTYNKQSKEFLNNPNVTEAEGRRMLSSYIGWDIQGKYINSQAHIDRMSKYYKQIENITSQREFRQEDSEEIPALPQNLSPSLIEDYNKMSTRQKRNFHSALSKLSDNPNAAVERMNQIYAENPNRVNQLSQRTASQIRFDSEEENLSREAFGSLGIRLSGGAARRGYISSLQNMDPELMGRYQNALNRLPEEVRSKLKINSAFRDPNDPEIQRMYQEWLAGPRTKPMADPRLSKHGRGKAFDTQLGNLNSEERELVSNAFRRSGLRAPVRSEGFGDSHTHIELDPNYQGEPAGPIFRDRLQKEVESRRLSRTQTQQANTTTVANTVSQVQQNDQIPPAFAYGGEMQTDATQLTAVPLDKRDNMAVMDEQGKVQFTMNDSERVTLKDGKAKIETEEKVKSEEIAPIQSSMQEREIERSQQEVNRQETSQNPSNFILSPPENNNMPNMAREISTTTDDVFKSPSFQRAMLERQFLKDESAIGGDHFTP